MPPREKAATERATEIGAAGTAFTERSAWHQPVSDSPQRKPPAALVRPLFRTSDATRLGSP
jgi:hypothetical protein